MKNSGSKVVVTIIITIVIFVLAGLLLYYLYAKDLENKKRENEYQQSQLNKDYYSSNFKFYFNEKLHQFSIRISKKDYDYAQSKTKLLGRSFNDIVENKLNDKPVEDCIYHLRKIKETEKLNEDEYLELIVKFVQSTIKYDYLTFNRDELDKGLARLPIQSLVDKEADCDELVYLATALLRHEKYDVVGLAYKGHMALGVKIKLKADGNDNENDVVKKSDFYNNFHKNDKRSKINYAINQQKLYVHEDTSGNKTLYAYTEMTDVQYISQSNPDFLENKRGTGKFLGIQGFKEELYTKYPSGYSIECLEDVKNIVDVLNYTVPGNPGVDTDVINNLRVKLNLVDINIFTYHEKYLDRGPAIAYIFRNKLNFDFGSN